MARFSTAADGWLVWLDIEMSNVRDLHNGRIMELAMVVTNMKLEPVCKTPFSSVVGISQHELGVMPECVRRMHSANGLLDACLDSTNTVSEVETTAIDYYRSCIGGARALLAGKSVHVDRNFLRVHMPRFFRLLHHRVLDVSSVLLTAQMLPVPVNLPPRNDSHRALDDVDSTIDMFLDLCRCIAPHSTV